MFWREEKDIDFGYVNWDFSMIPKLIVSHDIQRI